MTARTIAAPPTPWSDGHVEPTIAPSAYIHAFSKIVGDVRINENVMVAPGTSIRADEGAPFLIGANTNIQDGVVMHGLADGRVLGDDGEPYSIWIGSNTSITHKALIHGPAYVGDNCFIGFRSTVFNARINEGCIVMMHALIQDVEIPAGKYVPSGSIVTSQQQADRLPDVQPEDLQFTSEVIGVNDALRAGYRCVADGTCADPASDKLVTSGGLSSSSVESGVNTQNSSNGERSSLSMDIQEQVRQLLAQGCRISTEYADARRFRTQSWSSCPAIESTQLGQVLAALERCCQEHEGQYVRLLGVDTRAKRRVAELVIQRPGEAAAQLSSTHASSSSASSRSSYAASSASIGALSGSVESMVGQILSQGLSIGLEAADKRHFRAKSWTSVGLLEATSVSSAMRAIQACLEEHQGEFVRLLGVDRGAKKRVVEEIIQRPDGSAPVSNVSSSGPSRYRSVPSANGSGNGSLSSELVAQVRQALSKGYRIGTEHADKRRFRTKSWQSCGLIEATSESGVLSALKSCLTEHAGEYVRVLVVDPKAKTRILEEIVQRPGQKSSAPASASASGGGGYATSHNGSSNGNGSNGSNGKGYSNGHGNSIDPAVKRQIQELLSQGYKIGLEYADKRRFRAKSWQTVQVAGEALSSVAACLQDHSGDYVKLIGVDAKAKRRVFEEIVQRPS